MDVQEKLNKSNNGTGWLSHWIADRGLVFILMLISALVIWIVGQIFNLATSIEAMRLENVQRLHETQIAETEKIAELDAQIKVIGKTIENIDKRLNEVCVELNVK